MCYNIKKNLPSVRIKNKMFEYTPIEKKIEIYDTTLRDGAQSEGINFFSK